MITLTGGQSGGWAVHGSSSEEIGRAVQ